MSQSEQQRQQQDLEVVPEIPLTEEHQVGETEDGEPIMGRDRGRGERDEEFDFAVAGRSGLESDEAESGDHDESHRNRHQQEQGQEQEGDHEAAPTGEESDVPPAPPTPRLGSEAPTSNSNHSKIKVTNTASSRRPSTFVSALHHDHHESRGSSLASDSVASPDALAPLAVASNDDLGGGGSKRRSIFNMSSNQNQMPRSGAVSQQRSSSTASSTATSEIMRRPLSQQQKQQQQKQQQQQQVEEIEAVAQQRRSGSPARSLSNVHDAVVETPKSEHLVPNYENNQQVALVPAAASSAAIPGTSQHHLYKFDEEYENALKEYDSDVASSEAASRFAVGIHSAAASATRHFADMCELSVEEANRLADRRNKTAHGIRSWIGNELARYGFAGVAEELSQMTSVLVEDHRRRIELLEDRVRLQLKSGLSTILREQQHAGDALRAEFVKTASVEFAQQSLKTLIVAGGPASATKASPSVAGRPLSSAESIMQSLKHEQEVSSEELAREKGNKAAGDAYTSELLEKLSKIFDRQLGFALPKAQGIVGQARANFTRLAEKLGKIEDENVRRLAAQRDKAQKQVSDLEALAASVVKAHVIEVTETEAAIERGTRDLARAKDDKKRLEKDVWERQEEIRTKRKNTSSGLSAGGLLFGLEYLNPASPFANQSYNNNNNASGSFSRGDLYSGSRGGGFNDFDPSTTGRSKLDKDMDEKFKNATARSKALEERNSARLAGHRERAAENKNAQDKARNLSFSRPGNAAAGAKRGGGGGGGISGGASTTTTHHHPLGTAAAATATTTTIKRRSASGSPSLSRHNVNNLEVIPSEEKTRRHLQQDSSDNNNNNNTIQTREIDPREAVSVHTRNVGGGGKRGKSPLHQDAWIESEALRELVARTARHGLSFPDGTDPVVPTHKFLDDELAAIYELRHLRGGGTSATSPSK